MRTTKALFIVIIYQVKTNVNTWFKIAFIHYLCTYCRLSIHEYLLPHNLGSFVDPIPTAAPRY